MSELHTVHIYKESAQNALAKPHKNYILLRPSMFLLASISIELSNFNSICISV